MLKNPMSFSIKSTFLHRFSTRLLVMRCKLKTTKEIRKSRSHSSGCILGSRNSSQALTTCFLMMFRSASSPESSKSLKTSSRLLTWGPSRFSYWLIRLRSLPQLFRRYKKRRWCKHLPHWSSMPFKFLKRAREVFKLSLTVISRILC